MGTVEIRSLFICPMYRSEKPDFVTAMLGNWTVSQKVDRQKKLVATLTAPFWGAAQPFTVVLT